jgi:hypothetical protein
VKGIRIGGNMAVRYSGVRLPVFVMHKVCCFDVPRVTEPKSRLLIGVAETEHAPAESIAVVRAKPVPVREIVWLPALSRKDKNTGAVRPTAEGLKFIKRLHELPGAIPLVALGGVDSRMLQVSGPTLKYVVGGKRVLMEIYRFEFPVLFRQMY